MADYAFARLGFLSDTLQKDSEVYFRSTNMPRTIESLQQVIYGLYPTSKCDINVIPTLLTRYDRPVFDLNPMALNWALPPENDNIIN